MIESYNISLFEIAKSNSHFHNASFSNELIVLHRKLFSKSIIAYVNINSLRNEFEFLVDIVRIYVDILLISETKLNKGFPMDQFKIHGFNAPFRLDCDINGGDIMLYVREHTPAKASEQKQKHRIILLNLRNRFFR